MAEGRRIGLLGWILIGFAVGAIFGLLFKDTSLALSWIGDLFLRLLKMLIVPLVFFSLLTGTASISDPIKLGRVGVKIIGIYLATTAVAVVIGLIIAGIFNPAAGMKLPQVAGFKAPTIPALKDVLLNLVTTNPFESLSKGDVLPVIVFAILFGIAAVLIGDKGKALISVADSAAETMYKLTTIVMWFAPPGRLFAHRFHDREAGTPGPPPVSEPHPRVLPCLLPARGDRLFLHRPGLGPCEPSPVLQGHFGDHGDGFRHA